MTRKFATLLFDLDGTLVDTAPQLTAALNRSLEMNGLPQVELETCRALVGTGVVRFIAELTQDYEAARQNQVLADYQEIYSQELLLDSQLFPGVASLLEQLSQAHIPLVVVTNKPQEQAERLVRYCCSRWPIQAVIGATPGRALKPDVALGRELRERGWQGRDCLFIGDTQIDIEFARNVGFTSCAVTWGYRSKTELLAMRPDHCVNSTVQLLALTQPQRHAEEWGREKVNREGGRI